MRMASLPEGSSDKVRVREKFDELADRMFALTEKGVPWNAVERAEFSKEAESITKEGLKI